ncbi:MAG: HAMP domain-containing histidine kinase [Chloroflexota bacterium]|nr:HAMP domain-containing histidine kinase [Chloroflexota bacterium]
MEPVNEPRQTQPGGRPPWWPEGEAWPPPDGFQRRAGQTFLRRVGCFLVVVFFVVPAVGGFLGWIFGGFDGRGGEPDGPPAGIFLMVLVLVGIWAMRTVRRTAAPIGDVMEAANRVAGGDYAVRVAARGSKEVQGLVDSFNEMAVRLETNERQRRALLADVAHELRTPLSVIRGNVEGMLDGVYPRDDEHLAPVLEETEVMARLLDDLRTLSTAEAGALRLHREPTDPAELVAETVAAFAPRAEAVGVGLSEAIATDPDLELDVDPVRIRQVLDNLLSNALRHTPPGGRVRVEARPEGNAVAFAVRDTGRGIPAEALPHVFDRFWKSADSGGSGLGLAIARGLVEAHGGAIGAESRLGEGTTIRFTLPVR